MPTVYTSDPTLPRLWPGPPSREDTDTRCPHARPERARPGRAPPPPAPQQPPAVPAATRGLRAARPGGERDRVTAARAPERGRAPISSPARSSATGASGGCGPAPSLRPHARSPGPSASRSRPPRPGRGGQHVSAAAPPPRPGQVRSARRPGPALTCLETLSPPGRAALPSWPPSAPRGALGCGR